MWERELLGLYISAHPLDNYDAFFEEQTIPLHKCTPKIDGQQVTIGGLVTTIRTIITKAGTKMAFVGLEDKTGESEVIVFPRLYERLGDSLQQDVVLKISGRINSRDRDGNITDEAKLIADEVDVVTDKELGEYESHGRKMSAPRGQAAVKPKRYPKKVTTSAAAAVKPTEVVAPAPVEKLQTVYVKISNPNDHEALLALKQLCSKHPGQNDIVMVLGSDKSNAIRLPFRVDARPELQTELAKILGDDCVALK